MHRCLTYLYSMRFPAFSNIQRILVPLFAFAFSLQLHAQDAMVKITGSVFSKSDLPLINTMVVNQRTYVGIGADVSGKFAITALRTDTLLISSYGHQVYRLCFKDSVKRPAYNVRIGLSQLAVSLPSVSIEGEKSMQQIEKDRKTLGVKDTRMTHTTADALSSPITFLYERFSKFEQSKRKVAEMENEDHKREVLKDLFRIYIRYDVINLTEEQFDQFITYCSLPEEFIKTASQYELVNAIKERYERFAKVMKITESNSALSFERLNDSTCLMIVPNYDSLSNTDNAFQDYYYSAINKPDGKLIVKNEHGKIVRECYYMDGKMGKEWWWYSSGEKEWYGDWGYENRLKVYTRWYKNGNKSAEQDSTGTNYYWYEDGKRSKMRVPKGNCVYATKWYQNGKMEYEGLECDEKKTGVWKYYNEDGSLKSEEKNPPQ
jgi:hypothetical protein